MQVAIRELKNHLSKYLKQVQAGAEIIVTTHGKPVARFSQMEIDNKVSAGDMLSNLPWVHKSQSGKPKGLPEKTPGASQNNPPRKKVRVHAGRNRRNDRNGRDEYG